MRPGATHLMRPARAVLRGMSGTTARATRNRVPAGRVQLRIGRDLLWYPYVRSDGDWEPAGPPEADPAAAAPRSSLSIPARSRIGPIWEEWPSAKAECGPRDRMLRP
jgi:hypothetical protein